MNTVLSISKQTEAKDLRVKPYSIAEMILDPAKKKEADDHYNQQEYIEKDDFAKKLFGKNKKRGR